MTTYHQALNAALERMAVHRAALEIEMKSPRERLVRIHNLTTTLGYVLGMLASPKEDLGETLVSKLERVQEHANALESEENFFLERLPSTSTRRCVLEDLGTPPKLTPSIAKVICDNMVDAETYRQVLKNHLELGYSPRQIFSELNKVVLEAGKLLGQLEMIKTSYPELIDWAQPLQTQFNRLNDTIQPAITYVLADM